MTEQQPEKRPRPPDRGAYALSVSAAQAAAGTVLANGPKRLMGWSLTASETPTQQSVFGKVTAPAAGTTIASTGALAEGEYQVVFVLGYTGAPGAADDANFQWLVGGVVQGTLFIPGAAGATIQHGPFTVHVQAGQAITVQNIGIGTAGVNYFANIEVRPFAAQVNLLDGQQVVGNAVALQGENDTLWLGHGGVYLGTSIAVQAVTGAASGCVWVRDCLDDGEYSY